MCEAEFEKKFILNFYESIRIRQQLTDPINTDPKNGF